MASGRRGPRARVRINSYGDRQRTEQFARFRLIARPYDTVGYLYHRAANRRGNVLALIWYNYGECYDFPMLRGMKLVGVDQRGQWKRFPVGRRNANTAPREYPSVWNLVRQRTPERKMREIEPPAPRPATRPRSGTRTRLLVSTNFPW